MLYTVSLFGPLVPIVLFSSTYDGTKQKGRKEIFFIFQWIQMEIIVICQKYHRTSAKEGCYFLTVSGDFKSSNYCPFPMISPARQLRNS